MFDIAATAQRGEQALADPREGAEGHPVRERQPMRVNHVVVHGIVVLISAPGAEEDVGAARVAGPGEESGDVVAPRRCGFGELG